MSQITRETAARGRRLGRGSSSAAYVISYAAMSLPALGAGAVAPSWGLATTGYVYIAFVVALAVSAAIHAARMHARRRTALRVAAPAPTAG